MIEVNGVAETIREVRIWWINVGISGFWAWLLVFMCALVWKSPGIISALLEHKRQMKNIDIRSKQLSMKIEAEKNKRRSSKEGDRHGNI